MQSLKNKKTLAHSKQPTSVSQRDCCSTQIFIAAVSVHNSLQDILHTSLPLPGHPKVKRQYSREPTRVFWKSITSGRSFLPSTPNIFTKFLPDHVTRTLCLSNHKRQNFCHQQKHVNSLLMRLCSRQTEISAARLKFHTKFHLHFF